MYVLAAINPRENVRAGRLVHYVPWMRGPHVAAVEVVRIFTILARMDSIREDRKEGTASWNFRLAHFSLERISGHATLATPTAFAGADENAVRPMIEDDFTHRGGIGPGALAGAVSGGGGVCPAWTETPIESFAGSPPSAVSISAGVIAGVESSAPNVI